MEDDILDDPDDTPLWNCGCGLLVDGSLHCPDCGACAPWGCGMDHDDEDEEWDPYETSEWNEVP
jgi:hypothetical protein